MRSKGWRERIMCGCPALSRWRWCVRAHSAVGGGSYFGFIHKNIDFLHPPPTSVQRRCAPFGIVYAPGYRVGNVTHILADVGYLNYFIHH